MNLQGRGSISTLNYSLLNWRKMSYVQWLRLMFNKVNIPKISSDWKSSSQHKNPFLLLLRDLTEMDSF